MALWIEKKQGNGETVVILEGWLGGPEVAEVARVCQDTEGRICLELSKVQSVDSQGAALLRVLASEGVVLSGLTPYVELLLAV